MFYLLQVRCQPRYCLRGYAVSIIMWCDGDSDGPLGQLMGGLVSQVYYLPPRTEITGGTLLVVM